MREVRHCWGILGLLVSQREYARHLDEKGWADGPLREEDRARVASYLRREHAALAIAEYTTHSLGDGFGTFGGSSTVADGTSYWCGDAADYVET
ncbi:hypothetical protein [Streptomyces sp. NPDC049906]|uniref:hypothetical protein n=1 Tax=Streptomyces sp. NPDC049906 TaxID=3155656 RepID=UPI00341670EE